MIEFAASREPDITAHIARVPVAVLAVGAVEQHGSHLPVGTDSYFAEALANDVARLVDGVLLPSVMYGNSWANERYGGTITLRPATLAAFIYDIAACFARLGGKGIIVVNGDFGNQAVIAIVAQQLLQQLGMRALHLFYPGLANATARHCTTTQDSGTLLHADEFETSLMLFLRPDLVDMSRARTEWPPIPITFGSEPIYLDELSKSGTFGEPTAATSEKGESLYRDLRDEACRLCEVFVARLMGDV